MTMNWKALLVVVLLSLSTVAAEVDEHVASLPIMQHVDATDSNSNAGFAEIFEQPHDDQEDESAPGASSNANNNDAFLQEPCVLVERVISFTDGSADQIFCELQGADINAHGPLYLDIDGLTLAWADQHRLRPSLARVFELFAPGSIVQVGPGGSNTLILPDGITVDDMDTSIHQYLVRDEDSDGHQGRRELESFSNNPPPPTGEKKFLFIRVILSGNTAIPRSTIETEMLNANPSFITQYAAASFDQLTFVTMDIAPGSSDGILDVTINSPAAGSTNTETVEAQITNFLQNTVVGGDSIFDQYDHFLYIFPRGTSSTIFGGSTNWFAYARSPGKVSVYNEDDDSTHEASHVNTIMHEIGHNFCLQHSNEGGVEYEDYSGVMGLSFTSGGVELESKAFNGAKSFELGWYSNQAIELDVASADYTGRLCGVVDYDLNGDTSQYVVNIKITDTTSTTFVAFNRATGFNSQTNEGQNQVMITTVPNSSTQFQESNLAAKMDAGEEYVAPGNAFTVKVTSIDDQQAEPRCANIEIVSGTSPPTSSAAPSQSFSPTSRCQLWEYTKLDPSNYIDGDDQIAFLFNVNIAKDVVFRGMNLVLFGSGTRPYRILYASTPWESTSTSAYGEISAGNIMAKGGDSFTDFISFNEDVEASAGQVISFRIEVVTEAFATEASTTIPHPTADFTCPDCPFTVEYGRRMLPNGFRYTGFSPFVGILEHCNPNTQSPTSLSSSEVPSLRPSLSSIPSAAPSTEPTLSIQPSASPSSVPSMSVSPSTKPSGAPSTSSSPSQFPSTTPTLSPAPSQAPSGQPTQSRQPSDVPSVGPTLSIQPSASPSSAPSMSVSPSTKPSGAPSTSSSPSQFPSTTPTLSSAPSQVPSGQPTQSQQPSTVPSMQPSAKPSVMPSLSSQPSLSLKPSSSSLSPSARPSLSQLPTLSIQPSEMPSSQPTLSQQPSAAPSGRPSLSMQPSARPSATPSLSSQPSLSLKPSSSSESPSARPSLSQLPTLSIQPSQMPTGAPSISQNPSGTPSVGPTLSIQPSSAPSLVPSTSLLPSATPSGAPSISSAPSQVPSATPSLSLIPSQGPSGQPTVSEQPSEVPSIGPTLSIEPSLMPSSNPSESAAPSFSSRPSSLPSVTPDNTGKSSKSGKSSPSSKSSKNSKSSSSSKNSKRRALF